MVVFETWGLFSFLHFLAIWGPNQKIENARLLNWLLANPRTINVPKMHLKNRVLTILLTVPLTEVVPICTIILPSHRVHPFEKVGIFDKCETLISTGHIYHPIQADLANRTKPLVLRLSSLFTFS